MDVFRRFRALRRRPEKFVEDSLSSDCGALHLHHPAWYKSVYNNASTPNLLNYDDLHSLSSTDLGLSLSSSTCSAAATVFRTTTPSSSIRSESPDVGSGRNSSKAVKWAKQLPQIGGQLRYGPVPRIKLRASMGGDRRKKNNEVFRSNSFKFEKYEREENVPSSRGIQQQNQVTVSDDYHCPKDFVNRVPLSLIEEHPSKKESPVQPVRKNSQSKKPEFLLEVQYSDPADSKLYTTPGADPEADLIYKLYVGGESFYCRPYKPHKVTTKVTHGIEGLPDLPETVVDTVYEDVSSPPPRPTLDCVTIISVSPAMAAARGTDSPGGVSSAGVSSPAVSSPTPTDTTTMGSETSSDRGSFTINSITRAHSKDCKCHATEPMYENLDFHRVKISVPGGRGGHPLLNHHPREVNSRIVRRPRVQKTSPINCDTTTKQQLTQQQQRKFEKFGYSPKEVWNWLYTDDDVVGDINANRVVIKKDLNVSEVDPNECPVPEEFRDLYSVPSKKPPKPARSKTVEVKFSPHEFFSASSRLAHLDLDGLETFVGNTLEKALAKKSKAKEAAAEQKPCDTPKCCHQPPQQHPCSNCIQSGESSCSSALSSLESVRSGSGSSNVRSQSGSETLASELSQPRANEEHYYKVLPKGGMAAVRGGYKQMVNNRTVADQVNKPYQILEMQRNQTYLDNYNGLYDVPRTTSSTERYYSIPRPDPIKIDPSLALERQEWYHGSVTRVEAENVLRMHREGSYLVRNSESSRQDFSLSVKSSHGFMHMRIQRDNRHQFILGQFSKPFASVPDMVYYYTLNRLPIRGAEHMCLLYPVCEQLL